MGVVVEHAGYDLRLRWEMLCGGLETSRDDVRALSVRRVVVNDSTNETQSVSTTMEWERWLSVELRER
jgi:hypothetical protein